VTCDDIEAIHNIRGEFGVSLRTYLDIREFVPSENGKPEFNKEGAVV